MADQDPQASNAPATQATAKPARKPNPAGRAILFVVLLAAVAAGLFFGFRWWTHDRFVQSTNDAYVHADQVSVAPKVSGYVEAVYVADNQAVTAGQPLLKIDGSTYNAALATQEATAAARTADIEAAQRQVAQQQEAVAQAQAQLKGAQDQAAYAASEAERYRKLASEGVETQQKAAQAGDQNTQAQTQVRTNTAAKAQADRQVETLKAQIGQAQAQLKAAQAQVDAAKLNVEDTLIRASVAGRIGDKSVRVGQFVQPGARLMSVVPVQDIYLLGNFKETQLGRMKVGQHATVTLDAFGGRKIDAVLDSFAPGTGAQFALLPPENATGNFTKIVQRVAVRFRLLPPADLKDRILPGLSATVKIDTTQSPEQTTTAAAGAAK